MRARLTVLLKPRGHLVPGEVEILEPGLDLLTGQSQQAKIPIDQISFSVGRVDIDISSSTVGSMRLPTDRVCDSGTK